jgi:arsenate reductase
MLTIYHNPRCRKSRETLNFIKDAGHEVEIIEYLKDPPSEEDLRHVVKKLGISVSDLLRKNEAVFKEKYKGQEINEDDWYKILSENPILIERPIVVKDGDAILGRPPENVLKFLP